MKKHLLFLVLLSSSFISLFAQQEAKIMTYNLSEYNPSDTSRNTYFRTILSSTQPDIIAVEEITSQYAVNIFLNNVLNTYGLNYNSADFIKSREYYYKDSTSNALFYNSDKFNFISNTPITTNKRDLNEFKLSHIASGDTLVVYVVHLDAGKSDSTSRASEVDDLRSVTNLLPPGTNFIVLGDFNIYGSYESAYLKLLENTGNNEGYFIDPINMTGTWNNSSYAIYHTQATRANYGGLDDRFDMILFSKSVNQQGGIQFVQNSTIAYGNDGNHYNKSINEQPNDSVSVTIADALYYASDHLPVIATFQFFNATGIDDENNALPTSFSLNQNYPNPFNPETVIGYRISAVSFVSLKVFDVLGKEVADLVNEEKPAGKYEVKFNAESLPNGKQDLTSGVYFYRLSATGKNGIFVQTKKMILMK